MFDECQYKFSSNRYNSSLPDVHVLKNLLAAAIIFSIANRLISQDQPDSSRTYK